jgi:pyruvate formate lyase activating enzyme
MLVLPRRGRSRKDRSRVPEDGLFDFLKRRVGKLEGVVITGGEPTIHKDLPEFLTKIKGLGYKIKLDTNGTNPGMLTRLIKKRLVDYIAMDIKGPREKYEEITKTKADLRKIEKSIKIIIESGLPYEFRTTVVPTLLEKQDISKMGQMIKGARLWYLQQFKPDTDLVNKKFQKIKPFSDKELKEMEKIGNRYVKKCKIR